MIALLAKPSFHTKLLLAQISQSGFPLIPCEDLETAIAHPDVNIILLEHEFTNTEALKQSEAVLVGIDVPKNIEAEYDIVASFPLDWPKLATSLGLEAPTVFDSKTKKEVQSLLGGEAYRTALLELVKEIDILVENFESSDEHEKVQIVHRNSGASAMLGVATIHRDLFAIEIALKNGESSKSESAWHEFNRLWLRYRSELMKVAK